MTKSFNPLDNAYQLFSLFLNNDFSSVMITEDNYLVLTRVRKRGRVDDYSDAYTVSGAWPQRKGSDRVLCAVRRIVSAYPVYL